VLDVDPIAWLATYWTLLMGAAVACVWALVLLVYLSRHRDVSSQRVALISLYAAILGLSIAGLLDPSRTTGAGRPADLGAYGGVLLATLAAFAVSRSRSKAPPASVLLFVYTSWMVTTSIAYGQFDPRSLMLPALALLVVNLDIDTLARHGRLALRMTTLGSLWLLVQKEPAAFFTLNERQLFGFDQLAGLTPHPNVLGPVAAVALTLELYKSGRRNLWNVIGLLSAGGCCLLAESRSGWMMAAIGVTAYLFQRLPLRRIVITFVAMTTVALFLVPDPDEQGRALLNGRDYLWSRALGVWEQNWIVGAGPDAFGAAYTATLTGGYGVQAHNQLLHTLGTLGIVGGLLLVAYGAAILRGAAEAWRSGSWLPTALAAELIANCLGEVPIRVFTLQFVVVLIATAAVGAGRYKPSEVTDPLRAESRRPSGAPRERAGRTRLQPGPAPSSRLRAG
jgi:O-antigen ligase